MSKRILSLVLALVMVLGTFGTVFAADATENAKVKWLVENGKVQGYGDGTLGLDKAITRAEVATMVVRALGLEADAKQMENVQSVFPDMRGTNVKWANGFVNVAVGKGIINGYEDGTFKPSKNISYAEVASILVKALKGMTEDEIKAATGWGWATTYLVRAAELNILDDVVIADFNAEAKRETIFEMFYNTINKGFGNYTIVKGIVLENNRVETLKDNEIVVEVIKEIQTAEYAKISRLEKGNQIPLIIDVKVEDVENLLGKVADFTLDKDGKVVKAVIDTTYDYVSGKATATKNKLEVGDKTYTVELDERYKATDERIFRTYLNDTDFTYEDFYQDPATIKDRTRKTEFAADFAKVTVKNGKVLYIDAFAFEDIAPVESVRNDGKEISVYNDQRDARVEKYAPAEIVMGVVMNDKKELVFSRILRDKIAANDVVHMYKKDRLIVRQDAKVDGKFERVTEAKRTNFYVQIDGSRYLMNNADHRKPVYSFNSKEFMTLIDTRADKDLDGFRNEEVTALLDVNSDLQYIGAKIDFYEGITIIDQILSRGLVRFINPKNEKVELSETFDTELVIGGSTTNQRMSEFNRGDLTFVKNDKDNIDRMVRLATSVKINTDAKLVKKDTTSTYKFEMNSDYIRLDDGTRVNLLNRTNVFRVEYNANGSVKDITGTTVEDVRKGADKDAALRAFILTDYEYGILDVKSRTRISTNKDVAHTVVFVDYKGTDATLDNEIIRVTRISSANVTNRWIEGITATGVKVDRVIHKDTVMTNINVDDVVKLGLTKDDDKIVKKIDREIAFDAKTFKVVTMESRTDYRWVELQDAKGVKLSIWVSNSVHEFGTVAVDDIVTFSPWNASPSIDIKVIRSYGRNKALTGTWDGSIPPTSYAKLDAVYKLAGQLTVRIDNKDYRYVGLQTEAELLALTGQYVEVVNLDLPNNEKAVVKVTLASYVPNDKTALLAAINAANLKTPSTMYTPATWAAFATSLVNANSVYINAYASPTDISVALADLNAKMLALVPAGPSVAGTIVTDMFGKTLVVPNMIAANVTKVTINGRVLDAALFEYAFNGTDLTIAVNETLVNVVVTISGVDTLVVGY